MILTIFFAILITIIPFTCGTPSGYTLFAFDAPFHLTHSRFRHSGILTTLVVPKVATITLVHSPGRHTWTHVKFASEMALVLRRHDRMMQSDPPKVYEVLEVSFELWHICILRQSDSRPLTLTHGTFLYLCILKGLMVPKVATITLVHSPGRHTWTHVKFASEMALVLRRYDRIMHPHHQDYIKCSV